MTTAEGSAPRHGHRTPAELAEDEILAALRGEAREVLIPAEALSGSTRLVRVKTDDTTSKSSYALRGGK